MFDCVDPTRRLGLEYRLEKKNISYKASVAAFTEEFPDKDIGSLFEKAADELDEIAMRLDTTCEDDGDYSFGVGLLARLILSAVIEGDRCDTAAFMNGTGKPIHAENMVPVWEERLEFLEKKLAQFSCDTPVNEARHIISETCREFAENKPGIFRLNVPTGGGKTLSSLRYALAHAARFNKKRLIFVSPLLSILEQNASEIHKYVGDDGLILEHHSNAVQTDNKDGELDKRELLVQSWDSPIIITTLVQLLNTMFGGKTTCIRRFQALCDSVIVIDEVQTVPAKMLTMFNLAIQFLSEHCGATIVLCSATQPELELADHPLREKPREIVPRDEKIWAAFRRTELHRIPNRRLDELPDLIRSKADATDSLLVVCNKKNEAAYLLKNTESPDYRSFHLSAAMCMKHRRDVLEAVKDALSKHEKVLCIATQVIEAGVDISFGAVLRLTAGMDSVVQAAGRCNRSGESKTPRPVYTVNCSDEYLGKLRDIQRGKNASLALFEAFQNEPEKFDGDPFSDKAISYYYKKLYQDMSVGEQDYYIKKENATLFDLMAVNEKYADEDCKNVEAYCLRQAFKTAGQNFTVFDEDTTDVLVPYGKGAELINKLCSQRCKFDTEYRAAILKEVGAYTVGVYRYQRKQLEDIGALASVCDGLVLVLKEGFYDKAVGLTVDDKNLDFTGV